MSNDVLVWLLIMSFYSKVICIVVLHRTGDEATGNTCRQALSYYPPYSSQTFCNFEILKFKILNILPFYLQIHF